MAHWQPQRVTWHACRCVDAQPSNSHSPCLITPVPIHKRNRTREEQAWSGALRQGVPMAVAVTVTRNSSASLHPFAITLHNASGAMSQHRQRQAAHAQSGCCAAVSAAVVVCDTTAAGCFKFIATRTVVAAATCVMCATRTTKLWRFAAIARLTPMLVPVCGCGLRNDGDNTQSRWQAGHMRLPMMVMMEERHRRGSESRAGEHMWSVKHGTAQTGCVPATHLARGGGDVSRKQVSPCHRSYNQKGSSWS